MPPSTPVLDDFDRSDGPLGAAWSVLYTIDGSGRLQIASHQAMAPTGLQQAEYYTAQALGPDCEVWLEYPVAPSGGTELYARLSNFADGLYDGYAIYYEPGYLEIYRQDGEDSTTLVQGEVTLGDGDALLLRCVGPALTAEARIDGVWQAVLSVLDAEPVVGAGYGGFAAADGDVTRYDNFAGGTLGVTVEETVDLSANGSVSPASRLVASGRMTMSVETSVVQPARVTAAADVPLAVAGAVTPSSVLVAAAAASIACEPMITAAVALQRSGLVDLAASILLSPVTALTALGTTAWTATALDAATAALTASARADLDAFGYTQARASLDTSALVALGAGSLITGVSRLVASGATALQAAADVSPAGRLVAHALRAFVATSALQAFTGARVIEADLKILAEAGLHSESAAELAADYVFGVANALTVERRAIRGAVTMLESVTSASPRARAALADRLALDIRTHLAQATSATFHRALTLAIAAELGAAGQAADVPTIALLTAVADALRAASGEGDELVAAAAFGDTLH